MVTATGPAPGSEMTAAIGDIEDRSTAGVLHVAASFASHMVLQRNTPIAVFGALGVLLIAGGVVVLTKKKKHDEA